jgi:1-acyl-sn-glycerol-3-phosphate acyltransferase
VNRRTGPGPLARAVAALRAALFFGLLSASIVFYGLWLIPAAILLKRGGAIKWMCRSWVNAVFPLFGLRIRVEGRENLQERRTIFVSNHQSWLDITIMMVRVRFPAFLAKKEIASWPWFGGAMRILHCVFVDRSDRRSRSLVGRQVREKLSEGVDFCIFAEGTRSVDGALQPFQSGAFRIAVDAEALLTPVVIDETWWILNKKAFRLYPGTMRVRILPPVDTALPENRDPKILLANVRGVMEAALAEMRREPEASGMFPA